MEKPPVSAVFSYNGCVTQSLLKTKLFPPPLRPNLVARPRLLEQLNRGLAQGHKLSLIAAPAGSGKTTLAGAWIAGGERPAAWLSLDEGDRDPVRFLTYLIAALQTLPPDRPGAPTGAGVLEMVRSPQPPPVEAILTALLNEISALEASFILVLDDYHLVDSGVVDRALAFLLEHLPSRMHVAITTRADPDLPLARLRARGQLTEVRAADLRFTRDEAAGFLNQSLGLNLAAEAVDALENRTEGWIAGLQLAGLSLQGREDAAGFIRSFTGSHHYVMDYLVAEVLQRQPAAVRAFLLGTSILERLCGPLCEAVLGVSAPAGQEILAHLERANLLLVPLDERRTWYRYHHLLADVLQVRLQQEQPGRVPALHRRAAAWWEAHGFRAEAIRHALAAGDFEQAADWIEQEWAEKGGSYFRSATWLAWVRALPAEMVRNRLRLSLGYAWEMLHAGELEAAEVRLRDAGRLVAAARRRGPAAAVPEHPLHAVLAVARAFHAQALGEAAAAEEYARQALALAAEDNHHARGLARALLSLARLARGDLEMAYRLMADGLDDLRRAGNLLFATSGTFVLADIRLVQGRLREAMIIYEEALTLVLARGEPFLQGTADLYLGLGLLERERGNAAAARDHLRQSEALGARAGHDEWPAHLCLAQARLKQDEGELGGALALVEEAERLHLRSPVPDVRPLPALKARIWIAQGRLDEARRWALVRGLTAADELSYAREYEHITLARLLLAGGRGHREEALALLERLLAAAEAGGRWGSVLEIRLLQALAHRDGGRMGPALEALAQALAIGEPEGHIRIFVDEGAPLAELLTALAAGGERAAGPAIPTTVRVYARRLLAAFDRLAISSDPDRPEGAAAGLDRLVEPLSPREQEVLRLLADGLSNQEIGDRLFLALNTVKGHNRKIFAKLQVSRRTEAVARARALGLL